MHICQFVDYQENLKKALQPVEGAKYDAGKPDYSLLPSDSLVNLIRVYEHGVRKHGRDNWRKGFMYSRIFSAIMRHLWAWWKGSETNDEDEGVRHLAQAAWGCFTLLEYTQGTGQYDKFDDRYRIQTPVSIPSVWTEQPFVPFTITTTDNPKGITYIMKDGKIVPMQDKE